MVPEPLKISLCILSSSDPENTIDENLLVSELSVVIASSTSLDILSDEASLYNPNDSRTIPVDTNGFVSIREKTSEYKKDFCIAVYTVVASSTLYCWLHPEIIVQESMNNHHNRLCMFIAGYKYALCITKKLNIATDRKYPKIWQMLSCWV